MFLREKSNSGLWLISVLALLMVVVFCVNITDAKQLVDYDTILTLALFGFSKQLIEPSDTETLEKLVAMAYDFITAYPASERIDQVRYLLGKTLVQLGDVETGIKTLQELIENTTPDRIVVTRYPNQIGDVLRWSPFERGLLELGMAYDKNKQHDKADEIYKELKTHPKFEDGLHARIARLFLETATALRIGEMPMSHDAWIGLQAPHFWLQNDPLGKRHSLQQYRGEVVLLYFDATVMPNLKQVHEKYKDQRLQIININVDPNPPILDGIEKESVVPWSHSRYTVAKLIDMFHVHVLPSVFLIDSEGVIRKTNFTGAPFEKTVDELVTENSATYTDPRTKQVITKAVAAHGGLEKLQAVKNIVFNFHTFVLSDGSLDEIGSGNSYMFRDKIRWEIEDADTDVRAITFFDGDSIYELEGDTFTEGDTFKQLRTTKSDIESYKDLLFREPIWLLPFLVQNESLIQYVGTENVKGTPATVLRVRQPSGQPLRIFISEKTHHIVQLLIEDGPQNTVWFFEQYKDVDGIKTAHHWIEKNGVHNEIALTKIVLNAEIDPELFNPKK